MRFSLQYFAVIAAVISGVLGAGAAVRAQSPAHQGDATGHDAASAQAEPAASPTTTENQNDPVADPKAIVTIGHARFTVLTPELIRMEWAADGKFEDHASLVFLNRKLA